MNRFLIVGKMFSGMREKILQRGADYILLADSTLHTVSRQSVIADFDSRDSIIKACRLIDRHIDAVVTTYENYILPTAWIAHHFGLPGMPIEAAEACIDKLRMRELFAKTAEKISPDFHIVESTQDLLAFAHTHSYPLMLKPANLAKSLLITKNHNKAELLRNYTKMLEQIPRVYQIYAPHHRPKILIEEFMDGSIHSVDAFIDHTGTPQVLDAVVDYQTGYDVGYNDNFHYSRHLPSTLPANQITAVRQTAAIGCRTLGMKNSPAHIEIIMTVDGPRIVEIGARNGGYRERMHRLSNGIDLQGAALDIALNKAISVDSTKNEPCSVFELFPKEPGLFRGLAHETQLKQLPSLQYLSIKAKPGVFVGSSSDGYKMCAVMILHNANSAQFEKDVTYVNQSVYVQTKPESIQ